MMGNSTLPKGGALGLHPQGTGGGNLARGQPVNLVVHHDIREVYVAPGGVGEVVAADAVAVAVAAGDDNVQVMVAQLCAGGDRQGAAVEGVHPVGVEVARQVGGAPDPADCQNLVGPQPKFSAGPLDAVQDAEVAAAGTPVRVNLTLEVPGPLAGRPVRRRFPTGL